MMKNGMLLALLLGVFSANAATIAVIDSGVDTEHVDLVNKIWINPSEIADNNRDEDANGYQDDIYGWNFAENNNLVIDRSYIGTFSQDPYKFFDIQAKSFMGTATDEEKEWLKSKASDDNFRKEMGKFGNFVHGTHVAGITQKDSELAKILSVKLIPTEVKLPGQRSNRQSMGFTRRQILELQNAPASIRWSLLTKALTALAGQQMLMLEEIANYVGNHKADVANGSFGTGFDQAKMITDNLFKIFFFRVPDQEESDRAATIFMSSLIKNGEKMVAAAPNTLFVFAAGNSAMDNDMYPTSPTNIVADNVISVAATYKYQFLAPFSNYGEKMVDVAAPGMLINSQIPGNEYLKVSGTSQAAPYVANIAGRVKDINPTLSPKEIKKIILATVDEKKFLKTKVQTSGIVNLERAVVAATNTLKMDIDASIQDAKENVQDVSVEKESMNFLPESIIPIPLPSLFR